MSWTATQWTADDAELFEGAPVYHGPNKNVIFLRYTYYATAYDADRLCPLWVAHTDVGDTSEKAKLRTESHDSKWARIGFYPDQNVITYSTARHLPYVVDASYTNPNPMEFPGPEGSPTHITRGHNASNLEMKLQGDEAQGVRAQHESFSLANVSPQTQHHNAPLWATLEEDCLKWAAKLGRVAVITGPVFVPDPAHPLPISHIITTHGAKGPLIPVPTHFFKIITGRIDGKPAAIGFLVPHRSDFDQEDYRKYAAPITVIEKATSITFLPEVPANSTLKTKVDPRWLAMIPGASVHH